MEFEVFIGVDWGAEFHQLCAIDRQRGRLGEKTFPRSGKGLAEMLRWIGSLGAAETIALGTRRAGGRWWRPCCRAGSPSSR